MSKIVMAIVDESPILRDALITICRGNGLDVIADGKSAADAIQLATDRRLDVLVLDPTMQGGIDAISAVAIRRPAIKVIALSSALGADYAVRALEAGACGYILKRCTAEDFIVAVRAVVAGETFVTPSFASTILTALRDERLRKRAAKIVDLSMREHQVVRLLLQGRTNKEIAEKLSISEKTVKCYMTNVMQKLNARNRTEAVLVYQRMSFPHKRELSSH